MRNYTTKRELFAALKAWSLEVHERQARARLLPLGWQDFELVGDQVEATALCGDERLRVRCPAAEFAQEG